MGSVKTNAKEVEKRGSYGGIWRGANWKL